MEENHTATAEQQTTKSIFNDPVVILIFAICLVALLVTVFDIKMPWEQPDYQFSQPELKHLIKNPKLNVIGHLKKHQ